MKKSLLFAAMLLTGASMFAQEAKVVQVGSLDNSWGSNTFPMYSFWECSESEFLYTAKDLAGVLNPGKISKIEYAAYGGDANFASGYSIWLENTNDTSVGGEDGVTFKSTDAMTLVYKDATKYSTAFPSEVLNGSETAPGYLGFQFATPFEYTGGGLRVHFTSDSYWYNEADVYFLQDDGKVWDADEQNAVLRYAGGNWSREKFINPGRHFPVVKFTITEEGATAINDVDVEEVKNVTYYNIYGQKVAADAKGIVIASDGKKYINR